MGSEVQPEKAFSPIETTLFGMVILVMFEQLANRFAAIDVVPSFNEYSVSVLSVTSYAHDPL